MQKMGMKRRYDTMQTAAPVRPATPMPMPAPTPAPAAGMKRRTAPAVNLRGYKAFR